jgi:hypothetical protein
MTGAQGLQRNSAECEGNERGVRFAGAGWEPCGSYESILDAVMVMAPPIATSPILRPAAPHNMKIIQ